MCVRLCVAPRFFDREFFPVPRDLLSFRARTMRAEEARSYLISKIDAPIKRNWRLSPVKTSVDASGKRPREENSSRGGADTLASPRSGKIAWKPKEGNGSPLIRFDRGGLDRQARFLYTLGKYTPVDRGKLIGSPNESAEEVADWISKLDVSRAASLKRLKFIRVASLLQVSTFLMNLDLSRTLPLRQIISIFLHLADLGEFRLASKSHFV